MATYVSEQVEDKEKMVETARAAIDISHLDIVTIGSMYDLVCKNEYTVPRFAGVRKDSKLHKVLRVLTENLHTEEMFGCIKWDELMEMKRPDDGAVFLYGLSVDAIHAGIACMESVFQARSSVGHVKDVENYSDDEMREYLSILPFTDDQRARIMTEFKRSPDAVKCVFACIVESSLLDMKTHQCRPAESNSGGKEENAGEAPDGKDQPATETPAVSEEEAPQQTNTEIAEELSKQIFARMDDARAAELLVKAVRGTAECMTESGYNLSEMDGRQQCLHFNSNLASLVLVSYTLFGPDHPFYERVMNIALLK